MDYTTKGSYLKQLSILTTLVGLSFPSLAAQCPPIELGEKHPAQAGKDMTTEHTQPWCDAVCTNALANGTACNNAAGQVVTTMGVCNDPLQVRESILDIEHNLCINIDDSFISLSGYTGQPPGVNFEITTSDAALYFAALFANDINGNNVIDGTEVDEAVARGWNLVNELNSNGDDIIDRNEASQEKGSDPCQLLSTGFNSGLATDDILSYIGLYLGDPMVDKYAGDLEQHVKDNMLAFTRTWQPSYWKASNGSTLGTSPSAVTSYYDTSFFDGTERVCDAGYNGKFRNLIQAMGAGSSTGNTPPGDNGNPDNGNGGDNGNNDNPDTDFPVSDSCPSSHPYMCQSVGQCYTQEQMTNYCG